LRPPLRDDLDRSNDLIVEGVEFLGRNPVLEAFVVAYLLDIELREVGGVDLEAKDVADVAVRVVLGASISGDPRCIRLVGDGVEDRLPIETRRKAPPVAGGDQVELGLPDRSEEGGCRHTSSVDGRASHREGIGKLLGQSLRSCHTGRVPNVERRRRGIVVIDGCLAPSDLDRLALAAGEAEFEPQGAGHVLVRRERAQVDDRAIADLLWSVVGPHLPPLPWWFNAAGLPRLDPSIEDWEVVGCNPRSRFYRYGLGAAFSEHEDEPWKPDSRTRSMLTLLLYLPVGGCEGGETVIDGETVAVVDGRIVLFEHGLRHEGKPVERGQKLVLRNDVVGRPKSSAL